MKKNLVVLTAVVLVVLAAAGGGSGLAVAFTVASGPGTLSGTSLTVTGAGCSLVPVKLQGISVE